MIEEFEKHTKVSRNSGLWYCECKKGLWSVCARDKENAIREGQHYFMQYWEDGEYDGTPIDKLMSRI